MSEQPTTPPATNVPPKAARRARRRRLYFLVGLAIGIVGGYFVLRAAGVRFTLTKNAARVDRNDAWATKLDRPGLPNLHRVSDDLYRGARPDKAGYVELRAMGVMTVVNLEHWNDDAEESANAGMANVRIKINTWNLRDEHVVEFLKVMNDPARRPVFVHCQHGSDRTGTMCAMYRIFVQGWTKEAALAEMQNGGFGYHEMWENLEAYIRKLDLESIRRQAGLGASPATQPAR